MPKFDWDDLLQSVGDRSVVPIIGSELVVVPDESGESFADRLAQRTAHRLREQYPEKCFGIDDGTPLPEQIKAARREKVAFAPVLHFAHRALLDDLTDAGLPRSLRLLAEISDFPLIISTTQDGLMERALGLSSAEVVATQLGQCADLPLGWKPGEQPRLFQLFGRISSKGTGAVTEEDTLEYLAHLHDKGRPSRLFSHLRDNHLLFLGNQFPDWLARVFLRLVRGARFTDESREAFDAVADPEARGEERPLVGFLRAYSPQTRIFEEADTATFIRTLHEKWGELKKPLKPPSPINGTVREPAPMQENSIFISYAREDRAAAEALTAALIRENLPVWIDKRDLQGGDNYTARIDENIRRCRIFVPILSRQTATRGEGYFRREWQRALERLETIGPEITWVMPVVIDDYSAYDSPDLRRYFEPRGHQTHVLSCPGGNPGEFAQHFVEKFRAAVKRNRV